MAPDKWGKSDPLLVPRDVVLFVTLECTGRFKKDGEWRMGRVLSAIDRRVKIKQVLKSGTKTLLARNPREVSVVVSVDEFAINSRAYFSSLTGAEKNSNQKHSL